MIESNQPSTPLNPLAFVLPSTSSVSIIPSISVSSSNFICTTRVIFKQTPSNSHARCSQDINTSISTSISASERSPVIIFPGLGNAASDYTELATKLRQRGHRTVDVVPIERWQWGLNARGFFTGDYWRSTLKPTPILDWYFSRVTSTLPDGTSSPLNINIIGHSAGGWLARVYLSEYLASSSSSLNINVASLVTLGTPHAAPPTGVIDQTRGLLTYVASNCDVVANNVVSSDRFVCVVGTGVSGKPLGKGSIGEYVAFLSYQAVCGDGNVDGDGVTPVQAATVPNTKVIECKCGHSMLTTPDSWYGSEQVLERWADALV